MTLAKCKACGFPVIAGNKKCPQCGSSMKSGVRVGRIIFVLVLFIAGYSGFLERKFEEKQSRPMVKQEPWQVEDNSEMALSMIQSFVKRNFIVPSLLEFPERAKEDRGAVTLLGEQKYQVQSYVLYPDDKGDKIKTAYFGVIQQVSPANWQLLSLRIDETKPSAGVPNPSVSED